MSQLGAECPYCGGRFLNMKLITVDETAHIIGVARATVMDWIKKGHLDPRVWVKNGQTVTYMIDSYDIDQFNDKYRPRRSTLSKDSTNAVARRAYKILRLKHPVYTKNPDGKTALQKILDDDKGWYKKK